MPHDETSTTKARTAPDENSDAKPDSLGDITKPSWKYTAKKAWAEFTADGCTDLAAALTYYSVLSLFPALLALVSLLGVFGQGESTTTALLDMVRDLGQASAADQLEGPISQMTQANAAGFALVAGLAGALWSASGYVGAFGRAMNRIYQIDEGRPFWKLRPVQLLITLVGVLMVALVLLALVVSGPLAETVGEAIGLGSTAVTVWNIAKWPVILLVVVVLVALLYYSTPNVKQPKFRWVSVGAAIAIVTWVLASVVFGFYVANFGSYNKTYGSLAGVIVFLLWLWITNLALLFGAEVDSELERSRQLQAGIEAEETLQLPPRDDTASEKRRRKHEEHLEEGRRLREEATADDDEPRHEATSR
ncbi:YihY/virulence factor BrkB family protein [Knoellia sp. CPCC 206450]|uniref:YihY/virulence factor BrkB family protein n=1 Tax=Knoellia tibetensis TaxID=3404798 RepID=UPI003B42B411